MQKRKNILHNQPPAESFAQFTSSGARAIVETPDGTVFSFDRGRPKGHRFKKERKGFDQTDWLRPGAIQFRPAGKFPFVDLEEHLEGL